MRIKYKKIIRSTDLVQADLIRNILAELDKPGYKIIKQDKNYLEFKNSPWRFGSSSDAFRDVDEGTFELNSDSKEVVLTYYISLRFEILAISLVIIVGINKDYSFFYFIIFIVIMFIVRMESVRIAAKNMITNVLNHKLQTY